jgi:hypothetical protein
MDLTQRARELVSELRENAAKNVQLAQAIEMGIDGVGDPANHNRLSPEGLERARQGARNSWIQCPRSDCKVKHRRTHPHLKKSGPKLISSIRKAA